MASYSPADDPRWKQASQLFGATIEPRLGIPQINAHAIPRIRFAVCEAALGTDSRYPNPDAHLAHEVFSFLKPDNAGRALLEQCRTIARSAARATTSQEG